MLMSDNPELEAAEAHCHAIEQIPEEERSAEDLHALTLWREIKRLRSANAKTTDAAATP